MSLLLRDKEKQIILRTKVEAIRKYLGWSMSKLSREMDFAPQTILRVYDPENSRSWSRVTVSKLEQFIKRYEALNVQ